MARQRHGATAKASGARTSSKETTTAEPEGSPPKAGRQPPPGLSLVATPIGNMGDITLRAIETLRGADLVACEDTRVTGKLMVRLGLERPLFAYHEHNAATAGPELILRMKAGARVALVSDAGTPLVSDPGYRLVRACVAEGVAVTAVPGASALVTALQLSGLPTERFLFAGFLPSKASQRRQVLRQMAEVPATLMVYESPKRLGESLADMAAILGAREAAVARELTKLHEEVARGDLFALANRYAEAPPKGEVVVVVAPPGEPEPAAEEDLEARLKRAVADGASVRDAAALVAAATGHPRREVYARALALLDGGKG
ncbi:16S rRNA (cytidine(1402)-2'-O)-methyltransferase [Magnetospirillum sp. UT-4]|uniref:16S rRNA (cytidine(1402)-2'-O)-methyltransferase n=1 Tax=Magnetospirillum sp. UT-4 TaxID=2681467 RepID=UPI00138499AF|nr:16S rRNA (cytidine(1402)-2'-O)-methyltransferase [Magnetospirillum sp. UT-4]CAA7616306.1 putative methyltransferase [Magnetospirillum sp. UT-4]